MNSGSYVESLELLLRSLDLHLLESLRTETIDIYG
jgi:hypothetical protein